MKAAEAARAVHFDEVVPRHRRRVGVVLAERTDEGWADQGRAHAAEAVERPMDETAEQVRQQPTARCCDRDVLQFYRKTRKRNSEQNEKQDNRGSLNRTHA